MPELPLETNCQDVQQLLESESATDFILLDCREAEEHAIGTIAEALLLPMSELAERHQELSDKQGSHLVVYCHHGMRSLRVATWLRQHGFPRAQSMAGGIDQWSQEIDPTLTRY